MRPYLLDFLIEAHAAFGLLEETLFLAVNILDRYCSKRVVYRKHYQLVGCTALLIASKYGECSKKVPHIKELAGMCCSLYDEDMFIQMEKHVMITLEWCVGSPTIDGFLQAALEEGMQNQQVEHMALYISEISLFHRDFVSKRPSDLAKASLALARIVLNEQQPLECQWAANYDDHTLVALSQHLHRPSAILLQKYRSVNMSRVSLVLEEFLQKHAAIARCNGPTAAPPTPPPEVPTQNIYDSYANPNQLRTPQKAQYGGNMPLTPPITPDVGTFKAFHGPSGLGNETFPATPTSMLSVHPQQHQQHHPQYHPQQQPTYYSTAVM